MKKWVAFFSMTGNQICRVSQFLNVIPEKIITNNKDILLSDLPITKYKDRIIVIPNNPTAQDYIELFKENFTSEQLDNIFITLHGYLRIIPECICNTFKYFYNLHPGLINMYPQLKGKDPQIRAFNNPDHKYAGSVIHKVQKELDSGKLILFRYFIILDEMKVNFQIFNKVIQENSFYLWIQFLNKYLLQKGQK